MTQQEYENHDCHLSPDDGCEVCEDMWYEGLKTSTCHKCGRKRSYTNPMEKCYECKQKFCYDHIHCNQFKKGMKSNEPLRDVCEECKDKAGYALL